MEKIYKVLERPFSSTQILASIVGAVSVGFGIGYGLASLLT